MEIRKKALDSAVDRGVITREQADVLWESLRGPALTPPPQPPAPPAWRAVVVALGLAAGAALALVTALDRFGPGGLAIVAAALAVALLKAGWWLWSRTGGARGQVLICAAVLLVPLAALGASRVLGLGRAPAGPELDLVDWLRGRWFPVQAATALAAGLALRTFRIPFLTGVLGAVTWFVGQDAAPLLFGPDPSWSQRAFLSTLAGLVLLGAGLAVDRRTRGDHAFWLYLPGLLGACGGLVSWQAGSELSVALVAAVHLLLVVAALLLERPSFAVAGALGFAAAVGRLADDLLDSWVLSYVLAGLALALVALGLGFRAWAPRATAWLAPRLPDWLRRLLPPGLTATRD